MPFFFTFVYKWKKLKIWKINFKILIKLKFVIIKYLRKHVLDLFFYLYVSVFLTKINTDFSITQVDLIKIITLMKEPTENWNSSFSIWHDLFFTYFSHLESCQINFIALVFTLIMHIYSTAKSKFEFWSLAHFIFEW